MLISTLAVSLAWTMAPPPAAGPQPPPSTIDAQEETRAHRRDRRMERHSLPYRRHAVSTSAFMAMNLALINNESPQFFQLNYRFRITPKDVISAEAVTWRYYGPLGRAPWDTGGGFPGSVRSGGVGVAYHRFLWRGLFVGANAIPLVQTYLDEDSKTIGRGFQLFMTARVGYHVQLFKNRMFIEPSLGMTTWPIQTNLPASFKREDDKHRPVQLLEPNLHLGVKF